MAVFPSHLTIEHLNRSMPNTLGAHLGIEFVAIGEDYLEAKMPVDHRTHQPMGLLHGGASVALAETMGSVGAFSILDQSKYFCVGLEINANHLRGVKSGYVIGRTTPIHLGKQTHVWEIRIRDEQDHLICISRITMAILEIKK